MLMIALSQNRPGKQPGLTVQDARKRAAFLQAFADATRLQLLHLLLHRDGTICVDEIVEHFSLTQPTISNHLGVLRRAGLVDYQRDGLWNYYYVIHSRKEEIQQFLGGL